MQNVTVKEEKKGPTVEENDKAGDKTEFSLQNFEQNMRGLGKVSGEFFDELGGAIRQQQSYTPFSFGGGGWAAAGE